MWTVNVMLKGVSNPVSLVFKKLEDADFAVRFMTDELMNSQEIEDSFGAVLHFKSIDDIIAIKLENVEKALEVQAEIQLLSQRAQVRLQQKMASDPVLKFGGPMGAQNLVRA